MSQNKVPDVSVTMLKQDPNTSIDIITTIDEAQVVIIEGERKSGKFTFVSFIIDTLLKEDAVVLIPQEAFLFKRRIDILKRFKQLHEIHKRFDTYYLKAEMPDYKQRYGYGFFKQELEGIIAGSDAKIIFFHRFEEFFEFQDLYEIKPVLLSLLHDAKASGKKLIFSISDECEHCSYIKEFIGDFADLSIRVTASLNKEREVHFTDHLYHRTFPIFRFQTRQNLLSLNDDGADAKSDLDDPIRVFLCQYSEKSGAMAEVFSYLFSCRQRFSFHHASSLEGILNNLFLEPDIIIFLLERTEENLQTLQQVKNILPNAKVYVVFTQDFIRAEDRRALLSKGCDEVFAANFKVDDFMAAVEKELKLPYYQNQLLALKGVPHALPGSAKLHEIITIAQEHCLYFTLFLYTVEAGDTIYSENLGRKYDYYLLVKEQKLLFLAMNTGPQDAQKIGKHLSANGMPVHFERFFEGHKIKIDQWEWVL